MNNVSDHSEDHDGELQPSVEAALELLKDPNQHVIFYRSILAEFPLLATTIISFILAIYFTDVYPEYVQLLSLFSLGDYTLKIPVPLFLLAPAVLAAVLYHRLFDAKHIIGHDYVRSTSGLLSFTKHDIRLEYIDIRGIEISRGLYGRIVNVGTLLIGSAMKQEEEMHIEGIYDPSFYRNLILKRKNDLTSNIYFTKD